MNRPDDLTVLRDEPRRHPLQGHVETLCWEPSKAVADLPLPGVVMRLIQLLRDQNAEITASIRRGRIGRHIAILHPVSPWRGN